RPSRRRSEPSVLTRWRVEGTCGEVADVLGDAPALSCSESSRRSGTTRTSAEATIRARARGLPTTSVAPYEGGRAHQRYLGFPPHHVRFEGMYRRIPQPVLKNRSISYHARSALTEPMPSKRSRASA